MPIYQIVKMRVLQGVCFVQAPDQEHALSWAKQVDNAEIQTDEETEVIWVWDDDDPQAPRPANPMEDMTYARPTI